MTAKRKRAAFVYPPGSRVGGKSGKYPINTKGRARAALAYAGRATTAGSYSTVRKAVLKRYPSMKKR